MPNSGWCCHAFVDIPRFEQGVLADPLLRYRSLYASRAKRILVSTPETEKTCAILLEQALDDLTDNYRYTEAELEPAFMRDI